MSHPRSPQATHRRIPAALDLLRQAPPLAAQCAEWSSAGAAGIDPTRAGSTTASSPVEAAALRSDPWGDLHDQLTRAVRTVRTGLTPTPQHPAIPRVVLAAQAAIGHPAAATEVAAWHHAIDTIARIARLVAERHHEVTRGERHRLELENSKTTACDVDGCHRPKRQTFPLADRDIHLCDPCRQAMRRSGHPGTSQHGWEQFLTDRHMQITENA